MAIEKVININVQGNADEAVGSLRSQLRAAQADVAALSDKFGVTSVQAIEAAKKAGELKDKIGDAKALTDAFNPDAKFKALSSSLAGVAGGFAAVQGGMALLGVQSESVEKTLLKVQSAMALSAGLQQIGESIDSFKQLGAVIQSTTVFKKLDTLATSAATIVQRLFTVAVDTTAVSFNTLKTAIVSTGIGALVVGLGYLISKMNEASDATEEMTDKQKSLNKQLEYTKELSSEAAKQIEFNTQIELAEAKKRGASDEELTRIKIKGVNERLAKNTEEINAIKSTQSNELDLTKEQQKRIQDLRNESIDLERKAKIDIANFDADQAGKEREAQNKKNDEAKTIAEQKAKDLVEERKKEREDYLKDADELESLKNIIRNKQLEAEKENKKKADDIQKGLIEDGMSPMEKLQQKYDEEKAILEAAHQSTLLLDAKFVTDKKAIDDEDTANKKANADSQSKIDEERQLARQKMMSAYSSGLKTAASLLGESTDAGKAAAVAATTIDTIQSGVSAYKGMVDAVPGPVGIALGVVAAAGSLASGYASVKKILAVKTPKGGGGGGGVPTGGAPSAPSFNVVGNSGVNQLAGVISNKEQQQAPIQAYVVANDVTTAQSVQRNIIKGATLG
jgi:hypothetical protein